jgi:flagellar biosynthesis GTPase FlhF
LNHINKTTLRQKGVLKTMYTARNLLLGLATIISLSVAYYSLFALPAHNRKILQLEREKFEAAQKVKEETEQGKEQGRKTREEERQAEKQSREFNEFIKRVETQDRERNKRIEAEERESNKRIEAEIRERNLQYCLQAAEERYWNYIKLNGTPVPYKANTYTAPQYVWDNARKDKKDAVDECHRTWGRR